MKRQDRIRKKKYKQDRKKNIEEGQRGNDEKLTLGQKRK